MTDFDFSKSSALIIGVGGLGCPAALALARAGIGELILCDDDEVDVSNLHRQVLYSEPDVGRDKLDAARDALSEAGPSTQITLRRSRFLPENARSLVRESDIVVEGADNFATKFLAADASFLEDTPVVHGAAVQLRGTAWQIGRVGSPCYRCLFEDVLPDDQAPNCSEAGVLGPLAGVIGAYMADLTLGALSGDTSREGQISTFDGKRLAFRHVSVRARPECSLCGTKQIGDTHRRLYTEPGTCTTQARSPLH